MWLFESPGIDNDKSNKPTNICIAVIAQDVSPCPVREIKGNSVRQNNVVEVSGRDARNSNLVPSNQCR